MWYWFNTISNSWDKAEASEQIEEEYQDELKGKRHGQIVYHCFGNGWSTGIDFNKMETYCSSGRCMLQHKSRGLSDEHMTYKLKRVDRTEEAPTEMGVDG